jgi:hypothetical protein
MDTDKMFATSARKSLVLTAARGKPAFEIWCLDPRQSISRARNLTRLSNWKELEHTYIRAACTQKVTGGILSAAMFA